MIKHLATRLLKLAGAFNCNELDGLIMNITRGALTHTQDTILMEQADRFLRCEHGCGNQYVSFSGSIPKLDWQPMVLRYDGGLRPFASVRLVDRGGNAEKALRAELTVGSGVIREILYDKRPKSVFGKRKPTWRDLDVEDTVDILFNPDEPVPFPSHQVHDLDVLPEWLQKWKERYQVTYVSSPLSAEERARLDRFYELPFPKDYLDTISHFEHAILTDGARILGLSNIWSYITPTEYVVKLADVRDQGILCMIRNGGDELHYIDNEEHEPVPVGRSFRVAVEHALEHGVADWKEFP